MAVQTSAAMVIVLFIVAALFGLAAIALWAALASARLRLQQAELFTAELLELLAVDRVREAAELRALAVRRSELFHDQQSGSTPS